VHARIGNGTLAVLAIIFFFAFHYLLQKISNQAGRRMRAASTCLFRPFVAKRDRRKAIDAMQGERKKRGLPPLENPFL
jgi:hypothetical protein